MGWFRRRLAYYLWNRDYIYDGNRVNLTHSRGFVLFQKKTLEAALAKGFNKKHLRGTSLSNIFQSLIELLHMIGRNMRLESSLIVINF